MRVMALFSTSFFAKCLRVGEDGPGLGHLCHTGTFLVYINYGSSYVVHTKWGFIKSFFFLSCPNFQSGHSCLGHIF